MAEESAEHGNTKHAKDTASSHDEDESGDDEIGRTDSDAEEDDEEEEDEPKLKYARLTSSLLSIYRNGDATSAFMVAGDKMVGRRRCYLWSIAELNPVHWDT